MKNLIIGSVVLGTLLAAIAYNMTDFMVDAAKEKGKTYAKEQFNEMSPVSTEQIADSLAGAQVTLDEAKVLAAQKKAELANRFEINRLKALKKQQEMNDKIASTKETVNEKAAKGLLAAINVKDKFSDRFKGASTEEVVAEIAGDPMQTITDNINASINVTSEMAEEATNEPVENKATGFFTRTRNEFSAKFKKKVESEPDCDSSEEENKTEAEPEEKSALKSFASALLSKCPKNTT